MNQKLTITIDGKDGVAPDAAGAVLRALFQLVEEMDKRSWKVGAVRVKWRVSQAQLVNPLTVEAMGEDLIPGHGTPDLALELVDRLQEIERGIRPSGFTDRQLKLAREIGVHAKTARRIEITGSVNGRVETFNVSRTFQKKVNKLIRAPKAIRNDYGSLDGTLIQLSNDPLKDDGTARLRERLTDVEVSCHADPHTAGEIAQYVNRKTRVILYGTIRYEDDVPTRIDVESHTTVPPDGELPALDDIHAIQFRPPEGKSVEDYLDDLRGDD